MKTVYYFDYYNGWGVKGVFRTHSPTLLRQVYRMYQRIGCNVKIEAEMIRGRGAVVKFQP